MHADKDDKNSIRWSVNYVYLKDIYVQDGEYQDAYILIIAIAHACFMLYSIPSIKLIAATSNSMSSCCIWKNNFVVIKLHYQSCQKFLLHHF